MSGRRAVASFSRRYHFCASHRLHSETYDEARNQAVYGKCNHPHGHGHNYTLQVTVSGEVDAVTGMVVNLTELDAFAKAEVLDCFDHTNLNLQPCFTGKVSTTENLVAEVFSIFERFEAARVRHVRVEETPNNAFDYAGAGTLRAGVDL